MGRGRHPACRLEGDLRQGVVPRMEMTKRDAVSIVRHGVSLFREVLAEHRKVDAGFRRKMRHGGMTDVHLYHRHRFPPDVIAYTLWPYFRFPLRLRMVEDLLAERGIVVSHQTVRAWTGSIAATVTVGSQCCCAGRAPRCRRRRVRQSGTGRWVAAGCRRSRTASYSCRLWFGQSDAQAPLFDARAGRRTKGLQMSCVDHHGHLLARLRPPTPP